jgi:RecG-like helicase
MAALKKFVERLTKPVEDIDREKLVQFCNLQEGCRTLDALESRALARVAGEVQSVRIVPRAGAPSLEVGVSDGKGQVTAIFFGRRKIPGLTPGRRLLLEGVVSPRGGRQYMYNPIYELLS